MSRWLSALLLLVTAGSFMAAEPRPLRVSDSGRGLEDDRGEPVFLLADTAWSLALRTTREDAALYLQRRHAQGFNAITFVLFSPGVTELTNARTNAYGHRPFAEIAGKPDPLRPLVTPGADPSNPQQYDYWDHVDYLVSMARKLGLYVILLPTWGSGIVGSYDGKNPADIVFTAESARTYGAWLARRYGREPHVIWMLGGDRAPVNGDRDARPVFRALANGLQANAPRQLISYHPRKGAPQSSAWFHDEAWLAFNSIQEWPEKQIRAVAEDWGKSPPKPTWIFEGRYEAYWKNNFKPEDWGDWQIRQQAYQTVFSGAFGHTYGHERVFGFGSDGADWQSFLDVSGARSMGHLAALMATLPRRERATRTPAPDLIEGDRGHAERLKSDYIAALRTADDDTILCYVANGRTFRLHLERLARGGRFAYWFNPRRGTWHAGGAENPRPVWFARDLATPQQEFAPPTHGDGEDWILVLSRNELATRS